MARFIVVMREEQHFAIEAESEAEIRERIEYREGPPASWVVPPPAIEIHDQIISIEKEH